MIIKLLKKLLTRFCTVCCALMLVSVMLFSVLLTGCDVREEGIIPSPEITNTPANQGITPTPEVSETPVTQNTNPPYEYKDTAVDFTPTNELIIYIPAYSTLSPAMERYRELYPDVNLIEVKVTESEEAYAYDTRISAELAEGKGPDVIFPSAAFNMNDYKTANTGAFLNLSEIIAQDTDFNPDDYIESVFNGGVYRGHQYVIPFSFSLYSYTSRADVFNEIGFDSSKTGDSFSFLNEVIRCLPEAEENMDLMSMFPSKKYLSNLIKASGIRLVDYETNEVLPDEKDLKTLLEAYKPYYPVDYDNSKIINYVFRDDNSVDDVFYSSSELKSEGGFVSSTMRRMDGKLQAISYSTVAIRSNSTNQLNAWNFIKLLLSPEFQGDGNRFTQPGIPVLKSAVSTVVERAFNYYGGEVTEDKGITGKGVVFTQLSQEESKAYLDLFTSVDCCIGYSEGQLYRTFIENMEPYLADKQSYEDCIEGLKNDLLLYISE